MYLINFELAIISYNSPKLHVYSKNYPPRSLSYSKACSKLPSLENAFSDFIFCIQNIQVIQWTNSSDFIGKLFGFPENCDQAGRCVHRVAANCVRFHAINFDRQGAWCDQFVRLNALVDPLSFRQRNCAFLPKLVFLLIVIVAVGCDLKKLIFIYQPIG